VASLTVVGTGIQLGTHLTPEARSAIERADVLLYLAAEPAAMQWLEQLNPRARSLHRHYADGVDRLQTYDAMVEEILDELRSGANVCAAFYGHPGVFVTPSHEAIRRAREEGHAARMLPGISALDCLFADLGVDPAAVGCLCFEATDFLVRRRRPDPAAALVLLQVGALGIRDASTQPEPRAIAILVEALSETYPAHFEVVLYEASPYPVARPRVERARLGELASYRLTPVTTLYVPPAETAPADRALAQLLLSDQG
jgi:precorrin-2 methylase